MGRIVKALENLLEKVKGDEDYLPGDIADLVSQIAEHYTQSAGAKGEKGDPGEQGLAGSDGAGVASIVLTVSDGSVTAGTWTDTGGQDHEISVIVE